MRHIYESMGTYHEFKSPKMNLATADCPFKWGGTQVITPSPERQREKEAGRERKAKRQRVRERERESCLPGRMRRKPPTRGPM